MAARMDMTAFDAALKALYPEMRVVNQVYSNRPLLALMSKKEDCGGKYAVVPIHYGSPTGRSALFATAQTYKQASLLKEFLITYKDDFGVCSIDGKTIEASKGSEKAFMEALDFEIAGIIETTANSAAISMYREAGGAIGTVGAYVANAVSFTLGNIEDVVNFEVGMEICCDTVNGGGTIHAGSATITGVDRQTGIITTDVDLDSTITGFAVNDYVFAAGDYDAKMSGLMDWIPNFSLLGATGRAAKIAASFYGQTRNVDSTRQAGCYYDGSAAPIEEALIEAEKLVYREGGNIDYIILHPSKYANLKKALGSKVTYVDVKVTPTISFRGIEVYGMGGQLITILADRFCPSKMAFGLQLDTWKMYSIGKVPHFLSLDGLKMLREAAANAYEVRVGYYANLGCSAPAYNINVWLG